MVGSTIKDAPKDSEGSVNDAWIMYINACTLNDKIKNEQRIRFYRDIIERVFSELGDKEAQRESWLLNAFAQKWALSYGLETVIEKTKSLKFINIQYYSSLRLEMAEKCPSLFDIIILLKGLEQLTTHCACGREPATYKWPDSISEGLFQGTSFGVLQVSEGLAYDKYAFIKSLERIDDAYGRFDAFKKTEEQRQKQEADNKARACEETECQHLWIPVEMSESRRLETITRREETLKQRENELNGRETALVEKERELSSREAAFVQKERELSNREVALVQKESELNSQETALKESAQKTEQCEDETEQLEQTLASMLRGVVKPTVTRSFQATLLKLSPVRRVKGKLSVWPDDGTTLLIAENLSASPTVFDDARVLAEAYPIDGVISYFATKSALASSDCHWMTHIYLCEGTDENRFLLAYPFIHSLCRFSESRFCQPLCLYGLKLRTVIEGLSPFGDTERFLTENENFFHAMKDVAAKVGDLWELKLTVQTTLDFIGARYGSTRAVNAEHVAAIMYDYIVVACGGKDE